MWIGDGKCQGVRWKCLSPTGVSVYSIVATMYTSISVHSIYEYLLVGSIPVCKQPPNDNPVGRLGTIVQVEVMPCQRHNIHLQVRLTGVVGSLFLVDRLAALAMDSSPGSP